jgi:hypothetical protein
MAYEYKVVEEKFGSPAETEAKLNELAKDGWEYHSATTLGPIPSRWLYFRRPVKEA